MRRLRRAEAMDEAGAEDLRIDQRRDDADMREPEPDRDVVSTILHEQADDVSTTQAALPRPIAIGFYAGHEGCIGNPLKLVEERGRIATHRRLPLHEG